MPDLALSTLDRQSNRSSTRFAVKTAATNGELQAVADAVDAIILGSNVSATKVTAEVIDAGSAAPPADKTANRGDKWLMRMQDSTTGQIYTHEIGTADGAQLPSSTDDYLDLTAGVGLALKTAIETAYESPDGNAGVLLSVQQVNRAG